MDSKINYKIAIAFEKSKRINFYLLLSVTLLVIGLIFISLLYKYDDTITNLRKEYYKDQMISFCKIAENYNSEKYPSMYPCEKWVVKGVGRTFKKTTTCYPPSLEGNYVFTILKNGTCLWEKQKWKKKK